MTVRVRPVVSWNCRAALDRAAGGGRPYVFILMAVPRCFILILFLHSVPFAERYTFDQS